MDYAGRTFLMGERDCYSLLRDYYQTEFGIELPNYARPDEFWAEGLDLYSRLYAKNGFEPISVLPHEWRKGDVVLMAVLSEVPNHVGVITEDRELLHHMFGRLSVAESYKGIWRNSTVGVFRHKDVPAQDETDLVDIREVVNVRTS